MLDEHHWPGNVRELENTIERALVLARGGRRDQGRNPAARALGKTWCSLDRPGTS